MIDALVTGASGFIGRHLMSKLDGNTMSIPHSHLDCYFYPRHHRFFWLGTYGNMVGQDNQFTLWQSNILHIINALDKLVKNPPFSPFLFMSSSSVLLPVQTPYSRTKRACEEILLSLKEFPACIVRPYSVTGVGEQKEHLIPTLIRSCMEGTPMDFVPDATHDFVDVKDVVTGLLTLSKIKATGIHEFGNCTMVTNQEVRELVEEITGDKANIKEIRKLREYDDRLWYCRNPSEYWQPTKSLRKSIVEMVEQYKHDHEV